MWYPFYSSAYRNTQNYLQSTKVYENALVFITQYSEIYFAKLHPCFFKCL